MRKLVSLLLFALAFWSCTNEDGAFTPDAVNQSLNTSSEFIKLVDDGTDIAGLLTIQSNAPEVNVKWNINEMYNIDTTQTSVTLSGGKATLPVKWREKLQDGNYGPVDMMYKAGVTITDGDHSQYIPLIWAEKVDSAQVMQNSVKTRALYDIPRTSSIRFVPDVLPLNSDVGGSVFVVLENVGTAIFNYADFKSSYNLDLSQLPQTIDGNQMLNFRWKSSGAPSIAFSAILSAYALEITGASTLQVSYEPDGGGGVTPPPAGDLQAGSMVPTGNIPDEGGAYYCNFTGTYTGQVMLRATKGGVELARSSGNKSGASLLLNVSVPVITGSSQATISFEYSKDGVTWILIESRTQIQETLSVYPIQPSAYIPAAGGTVTCSVYGTYSKRISVHARVGGQVVATNSGTVPSSISLQIPANPGTDIRPIIFEYSKGGGPWLTLETKRQLGY